MLLTRISRTLLCESYELARISPRFVSVCRLTGRGSAQGGAGAGVGHEGNTDADDRLREFNKKIYDEFRKVRCGNKPDMLSQLKKHP
jgi:hypothetical protein